MAWEIQTSRRNILLYVLVDVDLCLSVAGRISRCWGTEQSKERLDVNTPATSRALYHWRSAAGNEFSCYTAAMLVISLWVCSTWAPGVVRIDPLSFPAGCRSRRLSQALSVLPLCLYYCVSVLLLTMAPFALCKFALFVCSVSWFFLLGCQYQYKLLTGMTCLQDDL